VEEQHWIDTPIIITVIEGLPINITIQLSAFYTRMLGDREGLTLISSMLQK
jgi:hypothetical protein